MHLALWQVNAETGSDWRVGFAGPHAAFAPQNEKHFLVIVKVIGGAAVRNRTDELGDLGAAGAIVDQHAIPAIGSGLRLLICESNYWRQV